MVLILVSEPLTSRSRYTEGVREDPLPGIKPAASMTWLVTTPDVFADVLWVRPLSPVNDIRYRSMMLSSYSMEL